MRILATAVTGGDLTCSLLKINSDPGERPPGLVEILPQRRRKWVQPEPAIHTGHVCRAEAERLPRRVYFNKLTVQQNSLVRLKVSILVKKQGLF